MQLLKFILLLTVFFYSTTLFAQKNVSYKYEKEERFNTIFGRRVVSARDAVYTKNVATSFVFDSAKNTIKIGKVNYDILSRTNCGYFLTGNWTKLSIVNLYDKDNDVELILQIDSNYYRYYFKRSSWKNVFGCTW